MRIGQSTPPALLRKPLFMQLLPFASAGPARSIPLANPGTPPILPRTAAETLLALKFQILLLTILETSRSIAAARFTPLPPRPRPL